MDIQSTVLRFIVGAIPVVSAAYIIAGIVLLKHKGKNKVNYFSFFMFASAVYSFGYFLELNSVSFAGFIMMRDIADLGSVFVPAFGILFIAQLTAMKITKKATAVLFSVSAILYLIYITNPVHHLFYKSVDLQIINGFAAAHTVKGPFYYAMMAYYAFMFIFSGIILAKASKTSNNKNDKNSFLFLLTAFQIPWLAILIILFGLAEHFDPGPVVIMIMCGMFTLNEIKNDMFKLRISRWKNDYDIIEEPAFLLNEERHIVCSNTAADKLPAIPEFDAGKIITDTDKSKPAGTLISVPVKNETKWFSVRKNYYDIKNNYITCLLIDVTEQKMTEKAILKSESVHKAMIAGISDVIGIMDKHGHLTYISPNIEKYFGWMPEEIVGTDIWQTVHPDDLEWLQKEFTKILSEDNSSITVKFRFRCKNGTYKWTELTGTNLVTDGIVNGVLLNSRDITDRKQAEDELKESRDRLVSAQSMAHIGSWELDLQTKTIWAEKETFKIYGFDYISPYLSLDTVQDSVLPEYRKMMDAALFDLISGNRRYDVEYKIRNKQTGEEQFIHSVAVMQTDSEGTAAKIVGTVQDITERKQMEQELIKSRERQAAIFNQSPIAIVFYDSNGYLSNGNDAYLQLFGILNPDEIKGYNIFDESNISEEIKQQLQNKESVKIEASFDFEKIKESGLYTTAKSGVIDLEMFISALMNDEQAEGYIVQIQDVTEQKLAKEKVLHLSYHDQLTGLYNRRYYDMEVKRLDDEKYMPLTLIMADVNGLKLTNDAFGHGSGDELLIKAAGILKETCRADDMVFRIGGDEFVILLPGTDAENAEMIIRRINAAIKNEKTDHIFLSVSMGYAVRQNNSVDMEELFMRAEDDMYRHKLSESSSMRSKTIDLIMNSLFEKNKREMLHSKRVGELCAAIAENMSFAKNEVNETKTAGLMHDIGKIAIAEDILNKPDKLNINEWNEVERHSEIGYRILSSVNEFSQIANYILEHHEKWDGTGYPKKLKGTEISLQARIIAVADSYDAMTTERTYKTGLSDDEAAAEIKKCSGTQFDPEVVNVFIEKVLGKAPE